MRRESAISHQLSVVRQRGFALVSAIFILVILAALGGFIVTMSTTQNASQGLDIQGARAYQAARAGIEWGTYQVLRGNPANCPIPPGVSVTLGGTVLANFSVMVSCSATNSMDGPNTVVAYQIISTASYGALGSPDYVERQLQATISTCRDPLLQPC
jgi:MSHA biogenesis protein MshP